MPAKIAVLVVLLSPLAAPLAGAQTPAEPTSAVTSPSPSPSVPSNSDLASASARPPGSSRVRALPATDGNGQPEVESPDEGSEQTEETLAAIRAAFKFDPSSPPRRQRPLLMPFVGVHVVEGIAANDFKAGSRLGAILGTRLGAVTSLNVEVAVNFLTPKVADQTIAVEGHDLTLAFSPLFHMPGRFGELLVGPKLGYWSDSLHVKGAAGDAQLSQSGWAFGGNVGSFFHGSQYPPPGGPATHPVTHPAEGF